MPNVYFQFKDFEQNFICASQAPRVKVQPVFAPYVYSGSYNSGRWIEKSLDAESSATFNNIPPNIYRVELWTHQCLETSSLSIPNDVTGSVTASDFYINNFSAADAGYSYRLVPVPENTASYGVEGWYAIAPTFYYVYSGTYGVDGIWLRTPLAYF